MKILLTLALTLILYPYPVMALPAGGRVAAGSAGISKPNRQNLNINQLSDKAIINWKGFSINVNELVRFIQPSSKSIVLNRVTGVDPSSILGQLVANGRVFIINPNGILFGPNSVVDVAGLLATTLNIKDADFIAGKFNFSQAPGQSPSYVINQGQIRVSDNGFVFLVASGVSNEGLVIANLGKVVMGSGEKLTVDFMGDGLITFAIEGKVLNQVTGPDGAPLSSAVANTGTIKADGGQVILSARASSEIFSSVVNNSGVIEARSLVSQGGVIRLEGSDPVPNTGEIGSQANLGKVENADGRVLNTGTLDVSAREAGAAPGEVTLSGQMVGVSGSILARGAEGAQGGRVLVTSSEKTILTQDSVIDTSGVGNSSAGNAVIWSDKDTVFRGTIIAKGGETGGNGGQIEVSGHENLGFTGQVNALAPNGSIGSVLLDPRNITVANGGGATQAQVDQFSDTPGVDQTIAPATINGALANVALQANNDITVTNAIAMTNAGVGITMQAGRDINVNANVSTNNGNISLNANGSAATAANRSAGTGDITMAGGTMLNAGNADIMLTVGSSAVAPFSPGSITVQNLTGGNIQINSPNTATLNGAIASSGTVTINANTDGTGAQSFTMAAGSSITTTDATANAVQINVNAAGGGTGTAALRNITTGSGGTLTVATNTGGNATGGDITQTAGTLLNVGAGTINLTTSAIAGANIGSSGANILTTAGTITASTGTSGIFVTNQTGVDLTGIQTTGPFSLTANGPITGSGPVVVGGTTTLTAGAANNITLNNAANDFSTVGITSGNNVTLVDSNALNLGASTIPGILNVTTAGAITDSGNLNVTGDINLAAGAGNDITLNSAGNNFSTLAITSGRNVTLVDSNALDLGASNVSGALNVTVGGAVTESGVLNVAGNTSFTATAANTDILLNTQANNLGGVVSFAGTQANFRDIALRNTNAGATVPTLSGLTSLRNLTLGYDNAGVNLPTLTATGTLNVTAGGAITNSGNLNVTGTTTLAAGAGNDIALDSVGNNFSTVAITSGRNVALVDSNALDLGTSTVSGTLNVTSGGALTQSGSVTVAGATTVAAGAANNITLNNAANDFSTIGITSANNVTLQDSNNISLGGSTAAGNFNITAGGAILDGGGSAINITATTANLIAASNIGTAADPLETSVGTLNATTTGGGIFVNEANAVTLGNVSSGGGNDIVISNTSGNMTVNSVTTAGGAVTLASPGGAIQDGNGAANNVTAGTLMVSAANGIDLDTTMTTLSSASVTATGSIDISNAGVLAVNNVTTANGNISLNATGGNLAINMVTAGGTGTVALSTTTTGDVTLGTVTTPNNVTITSAGSITGNNGAVNNINASTATLTAAANIGTAGDPIETTVETLNATATAGEISVTEADGVMLNNILAGGGNITISNTTGDMTINSITATAGGINLMASAGSILDGNGAANNLTAVDDANLRALGGVIGLNTDPIEVNINSGLLGVAATGQVGGVSVHINGTILPTNALTLLNSPPGEVIFNSRVLHPSPVNLPNLTGIAAELNPQRVNEDDYFTELLLDVLGEDFIKAQPLYCKLDDSLQAKLDSDLCTENDR